ncbi:MAG: hypothetical protein H6705_03715 [Myxococcales bacterium]|nr:hypothetical protein [Myxococcales bacterium]
MPHRPAAALSALAASLALVIAASPALAQQVKPRILLIFDTSGSMSYGIDTNANTGGDNSAEYPGDGNISRLYVAKNVIRGIVETTAEVDFALMRYPQSEGLRINDGSGRAAFTGYDGLAQRPLNYAGYCQGLVNPDPSIPDRAFALLEGFGTDNENAILRWLDHREQYPQNRELRAEGPTPIAETLRLAESYYRDVLRRDPALRCRRNYVVLLTDGAESCANPPATRQQQVVDRTTALRRVDIGGEIKDVRTFVIAFAVDEPTATTLDAAAVAGGTAMNGQAFRADDEAALRRAFSAILAEAIPAEVCNGEDDDCDERIDEGALNACGMCGPVPAESCNGGDDDCDGVTDEGVRNACGLCGELPAEVCNTIDDDCDGLVDEGVANPGGNCAPPSAEVCNGLDDDFDGQIDNQPGTADPLTRSCSTDTGACTIGDEYCRMGRWGGCDGVLPTDELCNGEDDDCDGITDEISRGCGPALEIGNIGQCRVGRQDCVFNTCAADPGACVDGGWSAVCDDAQGPTDEVCDAIDNDCDGDADEGLFNACGVCGIDPPEACNGLDDNCDGRIDEDAACPRGYLCYFGECVLPCINGECGEGTSCVRAWPDHSYCHPDPCAGAECGAGYACSAEERGCYDPCAGVECAPGEICELGGCVVETCQHTGCPEGQRCEVDACRADPCASVECAAGEYCREGDCVAACRATACGAGRACVDGACVPDPCGGRCLRGELCDPADGACYADPCRDVTCPRGTACVDGACRADALCVHIRCPAGTRCVDGQCTDFTPAVEPTLGREPPDAGPDFDFEVFDAAPPPDLDPPGPDRDTGGGGGGAEPGDDGCGCRADDGSPVGVLAWLLAIAAWRRRRRA